MSRAKERLFLAPNWHVDCRLIAELPEDSVVGMRFITYAISCAIAFGVRCDWPSSRILMK